MRSGRAIQEEINDVSQQAKAIIAKAKSERRDLTPHEAVEFDVLVNVDLPPLQRELADCDSQRRSLVAHHAPGAQMVSANGQGFESTNGSSLVLPINGVLPGGVSQSQFGRIGKLKCFRTEQDAIASGMWLRAVVGREYRREDPAAEEYCKRINWSVTNTGVEGTGSLGGYLVPAPLASAIIDVKERVGVMRGLVRTIPMTSDTLQIARRSSGLTVYYGSEAPPADMTTSDKGWSLIKLIAEKRYVVHQISQELIDDALIAVVEDAVMEMAYALARKEDDEIVLGDGTSTYGMVTGLLDALGAGGVSTAATGHDLWSELDLSDFVTAMGKLPDEFATEPSWLCSRAFYHTTMLRVLGAAGGNAVASLQGGDGGQRQFLGYPVHLTNRMPTTGAASTVACLFGTFSQAVILGERTGMRLARSDDFAFLRDLTTLKATARYDVKVHAPGTASAAGGYVALKTAA